MSPPRALFTITAGRTGTHYLASLFACVRGARAVHEDLPIGVGPAMVAFNEGDEGPMRAVARTKLRVIERAPVPYLEANHAFVKGYGWLLPELMGAERMAVIQLRRDPALVAQSLVRVRGVPGRTWWSRLWYLAPGQARNLAEPAPEADDLALGIWYAEEIERRAAAFRARFPQVECHEVTLEQLNDYAFVVELFTGLGLEVDPERLRAAVGKRFPDLNREFQVPPDLSDLSGLRDPDRLPPQAREALLATLADELCEEAGDELRRLEPGLAGETILLAVIRVVTGRTRALAERHQIALANTTLEVDLILALLFRLRPLDPMAMLFRRLPDGSYTLPAVNTDGSLPAVAPVLLGNLLRQNLTCRVVALAAGAICAAGLWRLVTLLTG